MKVLSVRQPWASLIVLGYKDIENRSWATSYRGPLLIQSSARSLPAELRAARGLCGRLGITIPDDLPLGGIVGITCLVDCVACSDSPWFSGPVGWKLADSRPLPFIPLRGQLGLFNPSVALVAQLGPSLLAIDGA
jgi:hypothetical protein